MLLIAEVRAFDPLTHTCAPSTCCLQIMLFLNHLYSLFDDLLAQYGVYKVETIGDW